MKRLLSKDDNRKLWVEVVTATFMDAVTRIDVLVAVHSFFFFYKNVVFPAQAEYYS